MRKLQMIWNVDDISKKTLLLYNSETWTLKEEHKRKLKVFEMSVLRKILGVMR